MNDADPTITAEEPEPTEAETEAVQRQCLAAARVVMGTLCIDQTLERQPACLVILRAMCAANEAWNTANTRGVDVDVAHVVATALFERLVGITDDDLQETHPYSAGGTAIEGYARAARLLEAYSSFQSITDDEWDFGTSTSHATEVLTEVKDQ